MVALPVRVRTGVLLRYTENKIKIYKITVP